MRDLYRFRFLGGGGEREGGERKRWAGIYLAVCVCMYVCM